MDPFSCSIGLINKQKAVSSKGLHFNVRLPVTQTGGHYTGISFPRFSTVSIRYLTSNIVVARVVATQ